MLALAALAAAASALYVRAMRRKNAEIARQSDELRRAQDARTRFLANVSHELRTPLTLLLGPLNDLRDGRFSVDPAARPLLDAAAANGRRLRRLIDSLLALARLDADALTLRRQRLDVAAFVRARVAAFGSGASVAGRRADRRRCRGAGGVRPGAPRDGRLQRRPRTRSRSRRRGGRVRVHVAPRDGGAEITVAGHGRRDRRGRPAAPVRPLSSRPTRRGRVAGEGAGIGLAPRPRDRRPARAAPSPPRARSARARRSVCGLPAGQADEAPADAPAETPASLASGRRPRRRRDGGARPRGAGPPRRPTTARSYS